MAHYNFRKDITVGERGEQIVRTQLENEGATYNCDNKNNEFDISMTMPNGKDLKFEIKTDVWCIPGRELKMPFGIIQVPAKDSGNMFIEFECRGKSSGVSVTKADYFVTYYPYYKEIWYITTEKLINLLKGENFPTTKQSGDEDSNTRGYLIPREEYKNHFKIIKTNYEWES